jgi:hypothetical protein
VKAVVSTVHPDAQFAVGVAGQTLTATAPNTGSWDKFETVALGRINIRQAGELPVSCKARNAQTWKAIHLARLEFTKAN